MTTLIDKCDACQKSTLSLLLLRPSPVAKTAPLKAAGSDSVASDAAVMSGLLPAKLPTESRFALRLLRAGYVHVYIASPPPGVKKWLVYRVTDQADLVPESNAWFSQSAAGIPCSRKIHNPTGLKLLDIPQAHKVSELWIAYSANLWNDTLRNKNKANPEVMQKVSLAGGSPNTFKPTAANLKSKVLECALSGLQINRATDHDFAFNSLAANVDRLAESLEKAAARHPKTQGKELAVVLRDPVGVATELNALRLRRHEMAKAELEKPENAYALGSINLIEGLEKQLIDSTAFDNYIAVSPLQTKAAFDKSTYPPGTIWQKMTPEDRRLQREKQSIIVKAVGMGFVLDNMNLGRVIYPDHDERLARWAKIEADKTWSKIADEFDTAERDQWLKAFENKMQTQHFAPQERMEQDWWAACQDTAFKNYFTLHFDENDPNKPTTLHSPGLTYTREVAGATTPAPTSLGGVLNDYLAQLMADAGQQDAVMLRALVANQKELIDKMKQALVEPGAADHLHENRNDKLYDLGSGLAQGGLAKYSWASAGLAILTGGYALQISQSLIAATMIPVGAALGKLAPAATAAGAATGLGAADLARLSRALGAQMVQQTVTMAMESIAQGRGPNTPILLTREIGISTMMRLIAGDTSAHAQQLAQQMERLPRGNGKVKVSVLTDSHTLAKNHGDPKALIKANPASVVAVGGNTAHIGGLAAATLAVDQKQFNALFRAQAGVTQRAAQAVRDSMQGGRAVITTLGGQLALGTMLINGVGLLNSLATIRNSKDAQAVRYAWYGLYDGVAGVLGGLMEVLAVGATAQALARAPAGTTAAAAVTAQSGLITGLRVSGALLGAVAGIVNGAANWARMKDAFAEGNPDVGRLYFLSAAAFAGLSGTSVAYGAGVAANRLVARGIGGGLVRTVSLRVGTASAASALSGWGLALLGAGLVFEVGAIILTPTPLEKWARRTRFGDQRSKRFTTWQEELKALDDAFQKASPEPEKAAREPAKANG